MARKCGYCKSGLEAIESPTIVDIAWAVGLYEGEGSVGFYKGTCKAIQLTQKDKWVLYKLKRLFGGSISKCGDRNNWQWHISGTRARGFILTIFTFLSPRRRIQIGGIL